MRIAVSGSSGFVGSSLCVQLIASGHTVVPLVRPGARSAQNIKSSTHDSGVSTLIWDPEHGLANPNDISTCDALVHLAGRSIGAGRWTEQEKRLIRDSRVSATRILAEQLSALASPPTLVISCSAVGIYGDTGDQIIDESASCGTDFLSDVAQRWEESCDPLRDAGVRVVHPRLGMVLSKDDGAMKRMLPLFRSMVGGRLGDGKQYWSWVSLADCVAAILWLLNSESASGAYNVISPTPVTNAEFTSLLAKQLSVPALVPAPKFALRLALGEMADALLLSSCRAVPRRLQESGFKFIYPELSSFLQGELG